MGARVNDLILMCISAYDRDSSPPAGYGVVAQSRRWGLFWDSSQRTMVMAFRGTLLGDTTDLLGNLYLLLGSFDTSPVFQREWQLASHDLLRAVQALSPQRIVFCGHSLGAAFSVSTCAMFCERQPELAERCVIVGFNSATSPCYRPEPRARQHDHNQVHFLVEDDIVSAWPRSLAGHLVRVAPRDSESALQKHNLRRMLHRRLRVPRTMRQLIRARAWPWRSTALRERWSTRAWRRSTAPSCPW